MAKLSNNNAHTAVGVGTNLNDNTTTDKPEIDPSARFNSLTPLALHAPPGSDATLTEFDISCSTQFLCKRTRAEWDWSVREGMGCDIAWAVGR